MKRDGLLLIDIDVVSNEHLGCLELTEGTVPRMTDEHRVHSLATLLAARTRKLDENIFVMDYKVRNTLLTACKSSVNRFKVSSVS